MKKTLKHYFLILSLRLYTKSLKMPKITLRVASHVILSLRTNPLVTTKKININPQMETVGKKVKL